MKMGFTTTNIWKGITELVVNTKTPSLVAVAYFGIGGAKMLPLRKGSKLVVDASSESVKTGRTNPYELIKLYKSGVEIFSLPRLHAKSFVIGGHLIVGSTNVSNNSATKLNEAVFVSKDALQIRAAKSYINGLCREDLGYESLLLLCKIYNTAPQNREDFIANGIPTSNVHVVNLEDYQMSDEQHVLHTKALNEAEKKVNTKRHYIDFFTYDFPNKFDIGSKIIQVYQRGNRRYIFPIGTIVKIRSTQNGECFIYCEMPNDLKELPISKFEKNIQNRLKRNGRIAQSSVDKITSTLKAQ